MATRADVCIVGMGAVGGIMAKELAAAGLKVVGLERGPMLEFDNYHTRIPSEQFPDAISKNE